MILSSTAVEQCGTRTFYKWLPEINKTMFTPTSTFIPVRSASSSLRDCFGLKCKQWRIYWVNQCNMPYDTHNNLQIHHRVSIAMNELCLDRYPSDHYLSFVALGGGWIFLFTVESHLCVCQVAGLGSTPVGTSFLGDFFGVFLICKTNVKKFEAHMVPRISFDHHHPSHIRLVRMNDEWMVCIAFKVRVVSVAPSLSWSLICWGPPCPCVVKNVLYDP